jgi:hypothetical protein
VRGATFGKQMLGIKVLREVDGQIPGFLPAFLRWLIPVLGIFACGHRHLRGLVVTLLRFVRAQSGLARQGRQDGRDPGLNRSRTPITVGEQRIIPSHSPRSAVLVAATHPLAVGALGLAAAGYLAVYDPNRPGHYPGCPILLITGYYCPGCGGLRALHDLIHGNLTAALSANLLVVLAVPIVVTLWCDWTRARLSGRARWLRFPEKPPLCATAARWAPSLILAAVIAFWVLRNLPPASWLAP